MKKHVYIFKQHNDNDDITICVAAYYFTEAMEVLLRAVRHIDDFTCTNIDEPLYLTFKNEK